MAFVVAVLVPITLYNALKGRFAVHRRFARVTYPSWMFVAVSGLVVYVMAVHLYPLPGADAMSGIVHSSPAPSRSRRDRLAAGALAGELKGWAWIAVGALALAGVFALLLALSRVPGMDQAPLWPIGFFYKGLVIHVVFSLVIWLLGVFAFLTTVATREAAGGDPRAARARADRAGRRARRLSLPVRAGLSRFCAARADQLCPAPAPSRLRRRPRPSGARRARAGRAPVRQSARDGGPCRR